MRATDMTESTAPAASPAITPKFSTDAEALAHYMQRFAPAAPPPPPARSTATNVLLPTTPTVGTPTPPPTEVAASVKPEAPPAEQCPHGRDVDDDCSECNPTLPDIEADDENFSDKDAELSGLIAEAEREIEHAELHLQSLEGTKDYSKIHEARKRELAAREYLAHLKSPDQQWSGRIGSDLLKFTRDRDKAPKTDYETFIDRTEAGNANLLVALAGGALLYVHEIRQWLRWDGRRWRVDTHEAFVTGHALRVAAYYYGKAVRINNGVYDKDADGQVVIAKDLFSWAVKCRSRSGIANMIELARRQVGVSISVTELDRKPHLLGVENGVVDLRTGQLRRNEAREDYVTKRSTIAYNPRAGAPRWSQLIDEATGESLPVEHDAAGNIKPDSIGQYSPRPRLAHYLQKLLGYCITGEVREQKMFLSIGEGSNGKGLIFDAVKEILGSYAVTIPSGALMSAKFEADAERPTALSAMLAGARFVVASESKEGQTLNAAMIKAHTGDRQMTARKLRENPFTFDITHKLNLLTNVRPALDHLDAAIKGRLHLVPFDRRWNRPGETDRDPALPDGDAGLAATLKAEYEGILSWLVLGAVLYYKEGLAPPEEVVTKTREYVAAQDHLGRWLATMRRCPAKSGTRAADLFSAFTQWCCAEGCPVEPANQTAFSRSLRTRGIESHVLTAGTFWGLAQPAPRFA
jgi:putative DNA primase/helicase